MYIFYYVLFIIFYFEYLEILRLKIYFKNCEKVNKKQKKNGWSILKDKGTTRDCMNDEYQTDSQKNQSLILLNGSDHYSTLLLIQT